MIQFKRILKVVLVLITVFTLINTSTSAVLALGETARPKLSTVDVSKLSANAVKILTYDINGVPIGSGSGFIASADGKIITNYHVISMKPVMKVLTQDDKVYDVLGVTAYDASKDIAIIKINAENLPFATLGNSDAAALGEEVAAFGYPLGSGLSVTFGNISSLTAAPGPYRNSSKDIQTTAPISPGNSGGPLLNMYGEVIGVNYSTVVNAQNMNNAIPINEIKPLLALNDLKTLSAVTAEVYPSMNLSEYEYYLFCNYPDFKTGEYSFAFNDIFLVNSTTDPKELYVEVDMLGLQFGEVLIAELEGNKKAVESWADDLYKKVKEKFPERDVYVVICLFDSFSVLPEGYTSEQAVYNSKTGLYDVFKEKLWYGYDKGRVYKKWLK